MRRQTDGHEGANICQQEHYAPKPSSVPLAHFVILSGYSLRQIKPHSGPMHAVDTAIGLSEFRLMFQWLRASLYLVWGHLHSSAPGQTCQARQLYISQTRLLVLILKVFPLVKVKRKYNTYKTIKHKSDLCVLCDQVCFLTLQQASKYGSIEHFNYIFVNNTVL